MSEKLLRLSEVEAAVGYRHTKIYSLIHAGLFPAPVRLGARAVRWKNSEIQAWIDGLSTEKQAPSPSVAKQKHAAAPASAINGGAA